MSFPAYAVAGAAAALQTLQPFLCLRLHTARTGINEEYRMLQVIEHVQALLLMQISVSLEGDVYIDTCEKTRSLHIIFGNNISNNYLREFLSRRYTTKPMVLLILSHTSPEDFLHDVNIPFDLDFIVATWNGGQINLEEAYRVSEKLPLHLDPWNGRVRFVDRRNNLHGHTLRATINSNVAELNAHIKEGADSYLGTYYYVWNMLSEQLNFTTTYVSVKDRSWGSLTESGNWNGMVGVLQRGEADVAVGPLSYSSSRMNVVGFSIPLVITRNSLFVRQYSSVDMNWTTYFSPFQRSLWCGILIYVFINTIAFSLSQRMVRPDNILKKILKGLFVVYNNLLRTVGILSMQGDSPALLNRRFNFLISCTAIIIQAAYTGQLTAFLAIQKPSTPFDDLIGLQESTYRLGVLAGSGILSNFQNTSNPVLQKLYQQKIMKEINNLPRKDTDGLLNICNINQYAFMTSERMYALKRDILPCDITEVKGASFVDSIGLSFQKGSPYLQTINHQLKKMRSLGILQRVFKRHLPPKESSKRLMYFKEDIGSVLVLIIFMLIFNFLSIIILLLEYFYHIRETDSVITTKIYH